MSANILLVEYEPRYVDRVRKALPDPQYRLEIVGDLEGAVARCASFEPHLVILTSVLPRIKIEDAITQLRARAGLRTTPLLILMSGYRGTDPQGDAVRYGAQDILERPFAGEVLQQRVERLLAPVASPAATQAIPDDMLEALRRSAGLAEGGPSLTSHELFGDILEAVEGEEASQAEPIAPAAAKPAKAPSTPAPRAAAKPPAAESQPPRIEPKPAPTAAAPPGGESHAAKTVEQSLADMLGGDKTAPPPKRPKPPSETDVETILQQTLAGLDIQPIRRRPPEGKPAQTAEAPAPAAAKVEPMPAPARPETAAVKPEKVPAKAERVEPKPEKVAAKPERATPAPRPGKVAAAPPSPPAAPVEEPAAARAEAISAPPPVAPAAPEVSPPSPAKAKPSPKVAPAPPPAVTAPPPSKAPAGPGTQFGQYVLQDHIATGGMAEVYKALMMGMEGFQKTVAIKRILPHLTDNDEFVTMFIDEAKLAAQLNHNNIIHIYDLGKIDRSYYIAMEYIDGRDLRSILQECRERKISPPLAISLYITNLLASALDYAHRKRDFDNRELGLVHRDVSPQNVLISTDGAIKLCDFGIAKAASKASHTRAGALKGKLQYMSPEQAWGKDIDHRSDLFSLGLVLYEMLTGEKVFAGDSELSILEQVRNPKMVPPSQRNPAVTADIDRLVMKALETDRGRRYQAARDLQRDIERVMRQKGWAPGSAEVARFVQELSTGKEVTAYPPVEAPPPDVVPLAAPSRPAERPVTAPVQVPAAVVPPEAAAASGRQVLPPVEMPVAEEVAEDTFARRAREDKRQQIWLFAGIGALVVVAASLWLVFRGGGGEQPPTPTPAPVVAVPTEQTPTPSAGTDIEAIVRERADAMIAEQEQEIRERIAAELATPTRAAATPLPAAPTATPPPVPTEVPALPAAEPTRPVAPPTATPRPQPTATPAPAVAAPSVREGDIVAEGPGVMPPELIQRVDPKFPPAARQMRTGGTVVTQILVGTNGSVEQVRILEVDRPGLGFEKATEEAAKQWRYKPATKDGIKVRMWVKVRVPFKFR